MVHKLIYAIDVNDKNESITEPLQMSELRDAHFLITNTYIAPSIDGKKKSSRIQPELNRERLKYQITATLLQHLDFEAKKNMMSDQIAMSKDLSHSEVDGMPISDVLNRYGLIGSNNDKENSEYP